MNRITDIGFIPVGNWQLCNARIKCNINIHSKAKNILYAFICDNEIKYIGKTTGALSRRMHGYQNPEKTQSTNVRLNGLIKNKLQEGKGVDILILVDDENLKRGDFKINIAAGLEDTLIGSLHPEWNTSGRTKSSKIAVNKSDKPKSSAAHLKGSNSLVITFKKKLQDTYYDRGFFNIPIKYEKHFGNHGDMIDIQLGDNPKPVEGFINRTDNKNRSPRIKGPLRSSEIREWIKSNFNPKEFMNIDIVSSTYIKLYK